MPPIDEQLVRRIAQRIIAQMIGAADADATAGARPVEVRPAAGVCTGDYSKFADRPDLAGGAARSSPSPDALTADRTFTGFVTARRLEDAGVRHIRLGPGARLTPLAADYVRAAGLTIEHAAAPASASAGPARANTATTWQWWIDGHCDAVRQLTTAYRQSLAPLTPQGKPSALADVIGRMARSVRDGRAVGGVLFVHSAAQAACFANRCQSLRAVVGTCGQAVQQGIDQLAANVLILEYPHHGHKSMQALVDAFIQTPRPALADVDRRLRELATCV